MLTKKEYAEMIADSLSDEEIKKCFDCTREQLEDDEYWNFNLEFQYNIMYAEQEYEQEHGNISE